MPPDSSLRFSRSSRVDKVLHLISHDASNDGIARKNSDDSSFGIINTFTRTSVGRRKGENSSSRKGLGACLVAADGKGN